MPCNVGVVTSIETVVRFIAAIDGRDVATLRELADERRCAVKGPGTWRTSDHG
jgi:hypothetical protein